MVKLMPWENISAARLRSILMMFGVLLELVAAAFGTDSFAQGPNGPVANIAAAGAACGIAIAGGLCFLSAVLIPSESK